MKLYTPGEYRGRWYFESNKYGDDIDKDTPPYPEILSDLKKVLSILIESKMLLPRFLEGKEGKLEYKNVEDLVTLIETDNFLYKCFLFGIRGDTIIYTEEGEETYSNIFSLEGFRTFQQYFSLSTKSDIWLPMSFDIDSYSFVWNLERHNLNYYRVPAVLKKINDVLGWENESLLVREFNELGSLQIGYDLFLSQQVITREYNENPNPEFNLKEYLSKME
ncbi:hypothetical protein A4H97_11235 [Niastella yeongjuensis]|uniref:Uncharacterized protein n=1 Tax=Niastella yeongjuensis TaxID=354355 RepID=A0A1V9E9H9_9BACT|nr:hypothetical protein [Niastella yeongjuensis]OQP42732.1 hypothetical protein A4H97_11235 [Niastella yeongjuensis]SEO51718.1 hypothetical protein SAMN05660816_02914 [Niastella yeongjuensis]